MRVAVIEPEYRDEPEPRLVVKAAERAQFIAESASILADRVECVANRLLGVPFDTAAGKAPGNPRCQGQYFDLVEYLDAIGAQLDRLNVALCEVERL